MYESLTEGPEADVIEGDISTNFMDSQGNLVVGYGKKRIAIIGLSNIAVVDTPTGLLVSELGKTPRVKELFSQLEKEAPEFVE
jgi:mannose-1-phosphate guanylyltransferase